MTQLKVNNAAYQTTININASKIKQGLWYFTNIIFFKNPVNISSGIKVVLLRIFGATIVISGLLNAFLAGIIMDKTHAYRLILKILLMRYSRTKIFLFLYCCITKI